MWHFLGSHHVLQYIPTVAMERTSQYISYPLRIARCTSQAWMYLWFTILRWSFLRPFQHPSIHIWRYSSLRALASLIRHLHSSLFSALLHPLIPSSCNASLWTTSAHLVLGLPTGLVVYKFPFKPFFLESFLLPFLLRDLPNLSYYFNVLHDVWLLV